LHYRKRKVYSKNERRNLAKEAKRFRKIDKTKERALKSANKTAQKGMRVK